MTRTVTELVVRAGDNAVIEETVVWESTAERDESVQFIRDGRVVFETARRNIVRREDKSDEESEKWLEHRRRQAEIMSEMLGGHFTGMFGGGDQ